MNGREIEKTPRTITEAGLGKSAARLIPENSVILSTRAPIGHLAINTMPMAFNQGCRGLIPKEGLDHVFLYYFLYANRKILQDLGTGTTFKELSSSNLRSIPITLPSTEEQRCIIAILDKGFEGLNRAYANVEANLQDLHELISTHFERELLQLDENFIQTTIGEICSRFEYGTSSKSQPCGSTPVLRMGNIQGGEIDWSDLVYTNNSNDIAKFQLQPLDVLFNRTNSLEHVGKSAIFREDRPAIFAGYLIRLHYHRKFIHPEFLNMYLNSKQARDYGRTISGKSVNQANISASKLKTYPITLPTIEKQTEIVRKIMDLRKPLRELERSLRQKLNDLSDLRQSLLQRAFAGELI